jgi:hypothetical protein
MVDHRPPAKMRKVGYQFLHNRNAGLATLRVLFAFGGMAI